VRALSAALRGRGHEVLVTAPYSTASDEPPGDGVVLVGRAVGIPSNGSIAPLAFGPLAAAGVRRTLRSFDPEVVHLHEPLIPSLSLLALWNASAPTVGTFHAAADASVGYMLSRPVLDRAARRLTVRTAVSDAARSLAERYFPGEYLVTPNGVDTARFANAEPTDLGPGRKVLFVGRIERRKGLEVLIQAMTRLRDAEVTLIVAGAGPEEAHCRKLAQQIDVPVRWLGLLTDDAVAALYKSIDVYCAPGLGGESFGIVLLEAMAAGAPVVCSDLTGYRAVAGGAAVLVPPGEPGPLADALRAVLSDEQEANKMRTMSQRLSSLFDWDRLVPGVERAYARAIGGT
jgi:phosphatidylinositol alpha-mannosyltransferase